MGKFKLHLQRDVHNVLCLVKLFDWQVLGETKCTLQGTQSSYAIVIVLKLSEDIVKYTQCVFSRFRLELFSCLQVL